ncbi:MAG: UDP-3-O-(3-hydroxymyristoyl)glucosamine N-acyltransferase [Pyrinomonadaceae bacterium]
MKLSELAERCGSTIEQGSGDAEISSAAGLDIARTGDITFLANPKYTPQVGATNASAIFLSEGVTIDRGDIAILRSNDAYVAYTLALRTFFPFSTAEPGVHHSAVIDESASVSSLAEIGANVVIGKHCQIAAGVKLYPNVTIYENVSVGERTVIHSGVSIRENCVIGANCIIHNNTTIGSDGFGYAKTEEKRWLKIPQVGRVVLEDDVEIGANSAIDCASIGESRIRRGAKIDNLVQIGHSCLVDEDALICAQTGLAGSSVIGKRVVLAGQVGVAGHLKVGDDAVITAKSATSHDVEPGKILSGIPAFDNRDWLRSTAAYRRLGEFAKKVRDLEKRLERIER